MSTYLANDSASSLHFYTYVLKFPLTLLAKCGNIIKTINDKKTGTVKGIKQQIRSYNLEQVIMLIEMSILACIPELYPSIYL